MWCHCRELFLQEKRRRAQQGRPATAPQPALLTGGRAQGPARSGGATGASAVRGPTRSGPMLASPLGAPSSLGAPPATPLRPGSSAGHSIGFAAAARAQALQSGHPGIGPLRQQPQVLASGPGTHSWAGSAADVSSRGNSASGWDPSGVAASPRRVTPTAEPGTQAAAPQVSSSPGASPGGSILSTSKPPAGPGAATSTPKKAVTWQDLQAPAGTAPATKKAASWQALVSTDPQPTALLPARPVAATAAASPAQRPASSRRGMVSGGAAAAASAGQGTAVSGGGSSWGPAAGGGSYAQQMCLYRAKLAAEQAAAAAGTDEMGRDCAGAPDPEPTTVSAGGTKAQQQVAAGQPVGVVQRAAAQHTVTAHDGGACLGPENSGKPCLAAEQPDGCSQVLPPPAAAAPAVESAAAGGGPGPGVVAQPGPSVAAASRGDGAEETAAAQQAGAGGEEGGHARWQGFEAAAEGLASGSSAYEVEPPAGLGLISSSTPSGAAQQWTSRPAASRQVAAQQAAPQPAGGCTAREVAPQQIDRNPQQSSTAWSDPARVDNSPQALLPANTANRGLSIRDSGPHHGSTQGPAAPSQQGEQACCQAEAEERLGQRLAAAAGAAAAKVRAGSAIVDKGGAGVNQQHAQPLVPPHKAGDSYWPLIDLTRCRPLAAAGALAAAAPAGTGAAGGGSAGQAAAAAQAGRSSPRGNGCRWGK